MENGTQQFNQNLTAPDNNEGSFLERFQTRSRVRWLLGQYASLHELKQPAQLSWYDRLANQETPDSALLEVAPEDQIDINEYIDRRRTAPNWTLVEIGPGKFPSGLNRRFTADSQYIGVENNSFRDYSEDANGIFRQLKKQRPSENIRLIEQDFGRRPDQSKPRQLHYNLPNEIASEIYISRVYDKPEVPYCEHYGDELAMTCETARLLRTDGLALIFDYSRNIRQITGYLKEAGMKLRFVSQGLIYDSNSGRIISSPMQRQAHNSLLDQLDVASGAADLIIAASKIT